MIFWLNINVSGVVADMLIRKQILTRTRTRKLFNLLGNLLPAIFVLGLAFMNCKLKYLAVTFLTIGVTFTYVRLSCSPLFIARDTFRGCCYGGGFMLTANDIAPAYAGIIFGISNTFATVPGIISPYIVGALTEKVSHGSFLRRSPHIMLRTCIVRILTIGVTSSLSAQRYTLSAW